MQRPCFCPHSQHFALSWGRGCCSVAMFLPFTQLQCCTGSIFFRMLWNVHHFVLTLSILPFTLLPCCASSKVFGMPCNGHVFSLIFRICPTPSYNAAQAQNFLECCVTAIFLPSFQHFALPTALMLRSLKLFWVDEQQPCFCTHSQHFALHPAAMLCNVKFFGMLWSGHPLVFIHGIVDGAGGNFLGVGVSYISSKIVRDLGSLPRSAMLGDFWDRECQSGVRFLGPGSGWRRGTACDWGVLCVSCGRSEICGVGQGQGGLIPISECFLASIAGVWRLEGGLGARVST